MKKVRKRSLQTVVVVLGFIECVTNVQRGDLTSGLLAGISQFGYEFLAEKSRTFPCWPRQTGGKVVLSFLLLLFQSA